MKQPAHVSLTTKLLTKSQESRRCSPTLITAALSQSYAGVQNTLATSRGNPAEELREDSKVTPSWVRCLESLKKAIQQTNEIEYFKNQGPYPVDLKIVGLLSKDTNKKDSPRSWIQPHTWRTKVAGNNQLL